MRGDQTRQGFQRAFYVRAEKAPTKTLGCAFLYCLCEVAQTLYTTGLRFILVLHLFT